MPEVRTSGSFANEAERLTWVQPRDVWQGLLFRHYGTFSLNGLSFPIEPFDLVVVPPGAYCDVHRVGMDVYLYDYFSFAPVSSERDQVALPTKTNLGNEGYFWEMNFRKALNRIQTSRTSVQVVVTALLWAVAEPAHHAERNVHIEEAERLIEDRLGSPLRIGAIAKELHLSQSQLARLFLSVHGRTPLQFVRDRRAQLAHRLLTQSTVPIKQVASQCGMPDLHAFNRFVRQRLGASPRDVRANRSKAVDIYRASDYKR
jgi:AraC-like DNA-binding protein